MRYDADNIASNIERSKKINKVLLILITLILIIMVLFSLFLISLELGNSEELPSFLNMNIYIVTSESMMPKLKKDDVIFVQKGFSNEEYKVGNIITYARADGEIITHRIEKIVLADMRNAYITKGDNNDLEDEEVVKYNMIIGKVVYTAPKLGKLIKLLKNKIFFYFTIIILILILLYDRRVMKRKEKRKEIRERYEKKSDFYF